MNLPAPVPHPIFLDMDGVVANFFEGVARLFGLSSDELPLGEYDMTKVLGVPFERIHDKICSYPLFWHLLPKYPWSDDLMKLFDFSSTGSAFILSHPWPGDTNCCGGKLDWLRYHYEVPPNRVIFTSHKYLLAAPGRLLIDDRVDECLRWRELGGRACEFPAHHNRVRSVFGDGPVALVRASLGTFRLLNPNPP